jgi:hypothetical protein
LDWTNRVEAMGTGAEQGRPMAVFEAIKQQE